MATPLYIQLVIDQVIVTNDQQLIIVIALAFCVLSATQYLLETLHHKYDLIELSYASNTSGYELFTHLVYAPLPFFTSRSSNNIISKFASAKSSLDFNLRYRRSAIMSIIYIVLGLFVAFTVSSSMAACTVIFSGLYVGNLILVNKHQRHTLRQKKKMRLRNDNQLLDTIKNIKQIKSMRVEENVRERFYTSLSLFNNYDVVAQRNIFRINRAYNLFVQLHRISVIVVFSFSMQSGFLTLGGLFAYLFLSSRILNHLSAIGAYLLNHHENQYNLENVQDLKEYPKENRIQKRSIHVAKPDINIRHVSFRYSSTAKWILYNISGKIDYGEKILLRGQSGGGKSTFISVVSGALQLSSGQLMLNESSVDEIGIESFRSHFATMMQDDQIIAGSILDNIIYSRPYLTYDEVVKAAESACIHNEIVELPMGYNTLLSNAATVISAGQKQRILLARALVADTPILVLDEATSNLDTKNKAKILDNLLALDKTVIFVSHDIYDGRFSRVLSLEDLQSK